ncbi:MAG: PRC-barrel domain-containing protein [Candidatus Heimdallarchaeota archaeon]|nr:PRC-barrel domain-containing protein [Candidatus Heimdallarchaeota archaeon]MCK5047827.1 PRC-barrel domain-containing protein [Candidatus Heimdallarchaeota archaeon]
MEKLHGYKYSQLSRMRVHDVNGNDVGRVIDFTFTYEANKVQIQHLILGDSRFVEFLEKIKLKPDVDPVVPWDNVEKIGKGTKIITLNVETDELKRTVIDPDAIPSNVIQMADFSAKEIVGTDSKNCGKVIDVLFDSTYGTGLVLGGSWLEELLEDLKLISDVDFILPEGAIDRIEEDKVLIKLTKEDLDTTITTKYAETFKEYDQRSQALDADKIKRQMFPSNIRLH